MVDERKAAIDMDALQEKPLDSMSAAEFISVLGRSGAIGVQAMRFWPEKKKYELWAEPENLGRVTIGGLFKGVREKKKYELEKDPRTELAHKPTAAEVEWLNPQDLVTNPAIRDLVSTVAREVVKQIGR